MFTPVKFPNIWLGTLPWWHECKLVNLFSFPIPSPNRCPGTMCDRGSHPPGLRVTQRSIKGGNKFQLEKKLFKNVVARFWPKSCWIESPVEDLRLRNKFWWCYPHDLHMPGGFDDFFARKPLGPVGGWLTMSKGNSWKPPCLLASFSAFAWWPCSVPGALRQSAVSYTIMLAWGWRQRKASRKHLRCQPRSNYRSSNSCEQKTQKGWPWTPVWVQPTSQAHAEVQPRWQEVEPQHAVYSQGPVDEPEGFVLHAALVSLCDTFLGSWRISTGPPGLAEIDEPGFETTLLWRNHLGSQAWTQAFLLCCSCS